MTATGLPIVRAKDIMDTAIHYIDGIATVKEAAEVMRKEKVTTLIVQKRTVDDAWGLIAAQDMIRGVIIADKKAEIVHVYEIMSKPIITVTSEMDIRYVAQLMNRVGISRAPVEDCGELVGIVSHADLILKSKLF
ncbi:MAG: CBS domain-containing protein [Desulfobacterales bacterium]|nr:CBS domain-containing protein [Desulfobacterales bacterium]